MTTPVKMIQKIIENNRKLFDDFISRDNPEAREIIDQLIHGTKASKSVKLYQYLVEAFLYTGGSDLSNYGHYQKQKVKPSFHKIKKALRAAQCPKLASFESFKDCGYRKTSKSCNNPQSIETCPLPRFDMKRGNLNQMAFSLYFFLRDICQNDFYDYVKAHFDRGIGEGNQVKDKVKGFIQKLCQIYNVGPKLADMAFSHLFFTQYPGWDYREIGAEMVAIDTLVHNFLARTGTLDEYKKPHKYGLACHIQEGCMGVIKEIAREINCQKYNRNYPAYFPRLIQLYIWSYCSLNGENVCNGNKCKQGKPNRDCYLFIMKWCRDLFLNAD